MTEQPAWQQNARLLLDRGWSFRTATCRWSFPRNGSELGHEIVETAPPTRLENMVVLLERGFDACAGGMWRRGSAKINAKYLCLPPEKFLRLVRKTQKASADAK